MSPSRVITFAKGVIKHLGNATDTIETLINMGVLDEKRATLALRTLLKTEDANEILILTEIDNDGKIKYSTVDVTAPAPSTPARSIKVEIPSSTTPVRLVDYMNSPGIFDGTNNANHPPAASPRSRLDAQSPVFVPLNDLSDSLTTSPLFSKLGANSPHFIPSQRLSDSPAPSRPISPKLDTTSPAFAPSKALIDSPSDTLSPKLNPSSPALIPSKNLSGSPVAGSPVAGSLSPKLDATSPAFISLKDFHDSPVASITHSESTKQAITIPLSDVSEETSSEQEKQELAQLVVKVEQRANLNPWSTWNAKEADKKLDEERARLFAAQPPVDPNMVLYKETYIPTAVVNGERMKTSLPEKRLIRQSGVESSVIQEVVSEMSKTPDTEKTSWDTYPDPSSSKALSDISEKERNKENRSPISVIAAITEKNLPHNQASPKTNGVPSKTHLRTRPQIVHLVSEGPKSISTFNFMKSTVGGRSGFAGSTKHWRGAIIETQEQRLGDGKNFFATEKGDRFEVISWMVKDKYLVRRAGVEGMNGFINIFRVDMSLDLYQGSAGMRTPSNGSAISTNH